MQLAIVHMSGRWSLFVLVVTGAGIGIRCARAGSYHWAMVLRWTTRGCSAAKYGAELINLLLQNPPWTDSGVSRVKFANVNLPPALFIRSLERAVFQLHWNFLTRANSRKYCIKTLENYPVYYSCFNWLLHAVNAIVSNALFLSTEIE